MFRNLLLLAIMASAATTFGGDEDLIRVKLDADKLVFASDMDKVNKSINDLFDLREANARKTGDKKVIDQLKIDRSAFADKGELPLSLPMAIRQKYANVKATMETAYTRAVREYTKAKKDEDAAIVQLELEAFQKGLKAVLVDPLPKDSHWSGTRKMVNKEGRVFSFAMTIVIKERLGDTFKGVSNLNGLEYPVEGTVTKAGEVKFTITKEKLKQVYEGQIKGSNMELKWTGVAANGEAISGTASLQSGTKVMASK